MPLEDLPLIRGKPQGQDLEVRQNRQELTLLPLRDGANNKIKPHWVHTNSHEEHHPEGNYYIQYTKDGKQEWQKIGKNQAAAVRAKEFQEGYFAAVSIGVAVKPEVKPPLMVAYTCPIP